MSIWVWLIIILLALLFAFGLWAICAANATDNRDDQIEWLKQEYLRQKRKHEITVRDSRPRKRR